MTDMIPGPLDNSDSLQISRYLQERMINRVGIDVWIRNDSGLIRTDRDTCTHCDDILLLSRQLVSLHPGLSLTKYDLDEHSDRADSANINLPPSVVLRGSGKSIKLSGMFSGAIFPTLLDLIGFLSQGTSPLADEDLTLIQSISDPIRIEAMVTPFDPFSPHMIRLLGALATEIELIELEIIELAQYPILAKQRNITEIPTIIINDKRFTGVWDLEPMINQIHKVITGDSEPTIREKVMSVPYISEEEAIERAREELARQQGNVGSNTGENTSPGGLIIPN